MNFKKPAAGGARVDRLRERIAPGAPLEAAKRGAAHFGSTVHTSGLPDAPESGRQMYPEGQSSSTQQMSEHFLEPSQTWDLQSSSAPHVVPNSPVGALNAPMAEFTRSALLM